VTRGLLKNLRWLLVPIRCGSPATKHNFGFDLIEDYIHSI